MATKISTAVSTPPSIEFSPDTPTSDNAPLPPLPDISSTRHSRHRSASQPLRHLPPGSPAYYQPPTSPQRQSSQLNVRSVSRSLSSNAIQKLTKSSSQLNIGTISLATSPPYYTPSGQRRGSISTGNAPSVGGTGVKGRGRSASIVTVTEVGGDGEEGVVDRLGGGIENAAWVNAPGAWLIHPVMIIIAKILIDALPSMRQDWSWTIVNLGYDLVSYIMFHFVTGVPFESSMTNGGAYDELTLWEQIDYGAQYTPAKKWLTSVPICLFLISTHYTRYEFHLFLINFIACLFVVFPKLPVLHRLRFHFLAKDPVVPDHSLAPTPNTSRPPSPHPMQGLAPILEKPKKQ